MQKSTNLDWYFEKMNIWQSAKNELRNIALTANLVETVSYGKPTYLAQGKKIFLLHTFKHYVALLFFKGSLMKDLKKILVQQTENVQAGRQLRFTSFAEIKKLETTIKSYIQEAIRVEQSEGKVEMKKTAEYTFVEEFQKKLDENPKLSEAFYKLTPGRQRGYLLYFSGAKLSKTRNERITKSIPYILKGKGRTMSGKFEE